jgi:hypothetical protein
MATLKRSQPNSTPGYRGKQAKTGNSLGLRFDKALFQSHPEFSGDVRAHVIAPGRMLVVAEPSKKSSPREPDPMMEAFLSFLAADITHRPQQIKPLDRDLTVRIRALVGHPSASLNEDLGDDSLV